MLLELAVSDLGVIEDLSLVLGPGMTALTGETGAGKTLVVEAIELLVGGRADPVLVRAGRPEARVEGRFLVGDDEVVLARVIPRDARSRAYVDGRLATVGALAEAGAGLVDLHGQHSHQSLLSAPAQRQALDRFGGVDLRPLEAARAELAGAGRALAELGGDARTRAREADLLRYQVDELDRAQLQDADEERALEAEEDLLAGAERHRQAAATAHRHLAGDGGTGEGLGAALTAVAGSAPFHELEARLRSVAAEVDDLAADLRAAAESIEEDPERLEAVRARRRLLHELRRKYGAASVAERGGSVADVIAFREEARDRLAGLDAHEERAAVLERARAEAEKAVSQAAAVVGTARRTAAPKLARAAVRQLRDLALPRARLEVEVGPDPGDEVQFLLAADPGQPLLALSKVASGGELARVMLALRVVTTEAPPTLVFDEVDAGIGGQAALAVGRSLAALAARHQVLVVTHLPQVAAFADAQVAVTKTAVRGRVSVRAERLEEDQRVVELSRMLSGRPDSDVARGHAEELLAAASTERGR